MPRKIRRIEGFQAIELQSYLGDDYRVADIVDALGRILEEDVEMNMTDFEMKPASDEDAKLWRKLETQAKILRRTATELNALEE